MGLQGSASQHCDAQEVKDTQKYKMSSKLNTIIDNTLKMFTLQRVIAFDVDLIVCFTISLCPRIGVALSVFYFLFRDILPFDGARSFGKSVYRLKVVPIEGEPRTITWRQAFVRNIVTLIPLVNIYDIYLFLLTGERLADQWSDTHVVILADETDKKSVPASEPSKETDENLSMDELSEEDEEEEYSFKQRVEPESFRSGSVTEDELEYIDTRSTND